MKKTIRKRIFTVNLLTVTLLLIITAVAFNLVARSYLEKDTLRQLGNIASRTEKAVRIRPPHPFRMEYDTESDLVASFINLMLAMRAPSSTIHPDYALIDKDNNIITPFENFDNKPTESDVKIIKKFLALSQKKDNSKLTLHEKGVQYAAVIKPIQQANGTKLGTLVIYSSLDKVNELQSTINLFLLIILLVSAISVLLLSNYLSRRISEPLSTLNNHIRKLSELNFSNTLYVPADNEIQELVQNINTMAVKLDTHNKSQKLFLQNASHEFRTPIMSIQSHAEGILYGVVESPEAAQIILDESKRLTHMVEELLYLSRLDAIEEIYSQDLIDIKGLIKATCHRMASLAEINHVSLNLDFCEETLWVLGDHDKLERCLSNIISNDIRYAQSQVNLRLSCSQQQAQLTIFDDGPGLDENEENQIFDRFYKGKKGNTGLGLAISKSIIEKHKGTIIARSTSMGAEFIVELPLIVS